MRQAGGFGGQFQLSTKERTEPDDWIGEEGVCLGALALLKLDERLACGEAGRAMRGGVGGAQRDGEPVARRVVRGRDKSRQREDEQREDEQREDEQRAAVAVRTGAGRLEMKGVRLSEPGARCQVSSRCGAAAERAGVSSRQFIEHANTRPQWSRGACKRASANRRGASESVGDCARSKYSLQRLCGVRCFSPRSSNAWACAAAGSACGHFCATGTAALLALRCACHWPALHKNSTGPCPPLWLYVVLWAAMMKASAAHADLTTTRSSMTSGTTRTPASATTPC
jgi:hypothetical protein